MRIGLRDGRLNDRCIGCKCRAKMQDWCDKYHENRNYCVVSCIKDHPECPRDHPVIKAQILAQMEIKKRLTITVEIRINENNIRTYCARRIGEESPTGWDDYEVYCPPESLDAEKTSLGTIRHKYEDGSTKLALKILKLVTPDDNE